MDATTMALIALIIAVGSVAFNQLALRSRVTEKLLAQGLESTKNYQQQEIDKIRRLLNECIGERIVLNQKIDNFKKREEGLKKELVSLQEVLRQVKEDCCDE